MKLSVKVGCVLEEVRNYLDRTVLTVCTVPYNMMQDENTMNMNEKMRHINEVIRILELQKKSIIPLRLLDVAWMMKKSLPNGCSSDGILFVRPRGVEWLKSVFQRHIDSLESELLAAGQFVFGPPPKPPFFSFKPIGDRLGERINSRDSSASSRSREPGLTRRNMGRRLLHHKARRCHRL